MIKIDGATGWVGIIVFLAFLYVAYKFGQRSVA